MWGELNPPCILVIKPATYPYFLGGDTPTFGFPHPHPITLIFKINKNSTLIKSRVF